MQLNKQAIASLIQALALTHDTELDCDSCFEQMAEFVEKSLLGQTIPSALQLVSQHIELCFDCHEEFELLRATLIALDPAFKDIA